MSTKWGLRGKRAKALGKVCPVCRKDKPECEFGAAGGGKLRPYCRVCDRAQRASRQATPEYREWRAEYRKRPDVAAKDRTRFAARQSTPERKAYERAYLRTTLGRAVKNRGNAAYRLRKATFPATIERIARTVALYDTEIARLKAIKARRKAEQEAE